MTRPSSPQDPDAAFGRLRDEVSLRAGGAPPQVIGVTSPRRGAGRTTVTLGLGRAFARAAVEPVLLVDMDLRAPALHLALERPLGRGVSDLLRGDADVDGAIQKVEAGLWLLSAGTRAADSAMLMTAPHLASLLTSLRGHVGTIVIDAPPMESGTEAHTLAAACESVLLVVRADRTLARDARGATAALLAAGANVTGVVLNDLRRMKGALTPTFVLPPQRVGQDSIRSA